MNEENTKQERIKKMNKNTTDLELERLEDFKKVLTFHIVDKIQQFFKRDYHRFYTAKATYSRFISCKNKTYAYDKEKVHFVYASIISFNKVGLDKSQVAQIFGKDKNHKRVKYKDLLENCNDIVKVNRGTLYIKGRRFDIPIRYLLPEELIKSIFESEELYDKVRDAGSDYYTDRQRRLIFTQLLNQKHYHYKTNKEIEKENQEKALMLTDQELDDLVKDL